MIFYFINPTKNSKCASKDCCLKIVRELLNHLHETEHVCLLHFGKFNAGVGKLQDNMMVDNINYVLNGQITAKKNYTICRKAEKII